MCAVVEKRAADFLIRIQMMNSVAIIGGGGMVGAATAYALMVKGVAVEILLVDVVELAAEGQALDVTDASVFVQGKCRLATFKQAGQADMIVIPAGYPQKPGESRAELLMKNRDIIKNIMESMNPIKPTALIMMVANPVDVLTTLAQQYSGLPHNQVFGSGTVLDSARLQAHLSTLLEVHPSDIHAYVLVEHGDRQFAGWSSATVGGTSLLEHPAMKGLDLDKIENDVMKKAYKIIEAKKSTYFGIGMCCALIVEAVLNDQNRVYSLTVFNPKEKVYMSWPTSVGRKGTGRIYDVALNKTESTKYDVAVKAIKDMIKEATS